MVNAGGITEIVYEEMYPNEATEILLRESAGKGIVKIRQFRLSKERVRAFLEELFGGVRRLGLFVHLLQPLVYFLQLDGYLPRKLGYLPLGSVHCKVDLEYHEVGQPNGHHEERVKAPCRGPAVALS